MGTIDLYFDVRAQSGESPCVIDADDLLEQALAQQFRWIRIDWGGLVQVDLPVEDDVMFLAMAYAELENLLETERTHRVFLGDGLLVVTAEREGEEIAMTVCHTPHLDRRFTETKVAKLRLSEYRQAWHGLMHQLVSQIQSGRT